MKLRPRAGFAYFMPDPIEQHFPGDSVLVRHPDHVIIAQTGTVVAVGPEQFTGRKFRDGRWVEQFERTEIKAGDRIMFPVKVAKEDLGHEITINGLTMRVFSFAQLRNVVILEQATTPNLSQSQEVQVCQR